MYCPECGHKITEENAVFCPECGTRTGLCKTSWHNETPTARGIIFTDTAALAEKLGTTQAEIQRIITEFSHYRKDAGISYRIVDAGDYCTDTKTIRLRKGHRVEDYMEILTDAYDHEPDKTAPLYLFIIGGHDIIPVPQTSHCVPDVSDDTIDTDILYAYPYGRNMLPMLEDMSIFRFSQAFHVGRLPLGNDTTLLDLCNYFNRVLEYPAGIPAGQAYGQCDPNWKNVSATVTGDLMDNGMLLNIDKQLPDDCCFRRLILSPRVTAENVDRVFHTGASLYYFNLHGSNAVEARGYFGAPAGGQEMIPALLPEHLASCRTPNVTVSEACYGARFIGMDSRHSMLLSSLYAKTLIFLGSSRIAWGNVDTVNSCGYTPVQPILADTMAETFIGSLLQGYTSGEALFLCRAALFGCDCSPNTIATVTEFNLFGDPFIRMQTTYCHGTPIDKSACVTDGNRFSCKAEKVNGANRNGSILDVVRNAVNRNIGLIQDKIGRMLYELYGIEPRQADSIFRMKYADGHTELRFSYNTTAEAGIPITYTAIATADGEIKNVIMTK